MSKVKLTPAQKDLIRKMRECLLHGGTGAYSSLAISKRRTMKSLRVMNLVELWEDDTYEFIDLRLTQLGKEIEL